MRLLLMVLAVPAFCPAAFGQEGGAFSPPADAPVQQAAPSVDPRAAQLKQELYAARVYRDEHTIGFAVTGAILGRLATVASAALLASTPYNNGGAIYAALLLGSEVVHLGFVVLTMVRLGQQSWASGYIRALEDEAARLGLMPMREF